MSARQALRKIDMLPVRRPGLDKFAYKLCEVPGVMPFSKSRMFELIAAGVFHPRKEGASSIIMREELIAYLDSLPFAPVRARR